MLVLTYDLLKFAEAKRRFERDYLEKLMVQTGWNKTEAAKISGLDRKTIYRILRRHGLIK